MSIIKNILRVLSFLVFFVVSSLTSYGHCWKDVLYQSINASDELVVAIGKNADLVDDWRLLYDAGRYSSPAVKATDLIRKAKAVEALHSLRTGYSSKLTPLVVGLPATV